MFAVSHLAGGATSSSRPLLPVQPPGQRGATQGATRAECPRIKASLSPAHLLWCCCHQTSPDSLSESNYADLVTSATTNPTWHHHQCQQAAHVLPRNHPKPGADPAAAPRVALWGAAGARGARREQAAGQEGSLHSLSLPAAASWEHLGSRREKDEIRTAKKSPRGAVFYLTLAFSYTTWDSPAQRFNLV